MAPFSSRMTSDSVIAVAVAKRRGCPIKHPSPQNSVGTQERDNGFLALLGDNGDFDLAILDIGNCIRRVALREEPLILSIFVNGSATVFCGQAHPITVGNYSLLTASAPHPGLDAAHYLRH
jgi:hypothetical protein